MDIFKQLENASGAPDNPLDLFAEWMGEAEKSETNDPNAMSLATIDPDGRPSLRIVLLKGYDERGFVFYTNKESRKGIALVANPAAALCFHWKTLTRQIRIEGSVSLVSESESDQYYTSRPSGSRIGAWASLQSRQLESRAHLRQRVAIVKKRFEHEAPPRPPFWGGYRVAADRIEFWHDGADRLHTRVLYTRNRQGSWDRVMLHP